MCRLALEMHYIGMEHKFVVKTSECLWHSQDKESIDSNRSRNLGINALVSAFFYPVHSLFEKTVDRAP